MNGDQPTTPPPRRLPDGWRELPLKLSIAVSPSGLISFGADAPRNLSVTGLSVQEAFDEFVKFVENCADLGRPFEVFKRIKMR